jgi:hypothetical protein
VEAAGIVVLWFPIASQTGGLKTTLPAPGRRFGHPRLLQGAESGARGILCRFSSNNSKVSG